MNRPLTVTSTDELVFETVCIVATDGCCEIRVSLNVYIMTVKSP